MEKRLAKRKMLRRKYKHYVAALAGAALMAGVTLHGVPMSKVSAAENTTTSSPSPVIIGQGPVITPAVPIVQIDPVTGEKIENKNQDKDQGKNKGEKGDKDQGKDQGKDKDKDKDKDGRQSRWDHREHRGDWYDHHRDRDRFERWSAFMHRMERYNERLDKIQIVGIQRNPVDVVRLAADEMGFNVLNDTFTLLSQNGTQSIVTVIHNGNSYNVTVDQLVNGNWRISFVKPLQ